MVDGRVESQVGPSGEFRFGWRLVRLFPLFFIPSQSVKMVSSYNRRNTTTRSILGLSLLATAATALPRPGHETAPSLISSSSVRKSLNWGLHAPATKHSLSNPSGALTAFNSAAQVQAFSQACSRAIDVASCVGRDTAIAFVEALHPTAQFQLVDGYTSKHNGVFHAHFLEVIDGKTVSNGNLNVNVDTGANEVLSYGDSSYASVAKAGEQVQGWKEKVAGWANHAEQVVLHAASGLDDGPQGQADAYSSPPLVPAADKHQQDPRHGLLSFLSLASTCPDLSALLASSPRADLVDAMTVTRTGDHSSAHTHVISNTPTLEPVKASLVYLHDGAELKMAWKYEILSDDNQYEGECMFHSYRPLD
jgi:extracellular elastinolytic metalloproteinase